MVASRRRRDDDGEDEVSIMDDAEDDSPSDASAISNADDDADAEASDASADDESLSPEIPQSKALTGATVARAAPQAADTVITNGTLRSPAATEAMLNGLKTDKTTEEAEELYFF